jgi:quinol monooxygenase YgiN
MVAITEQAPLCTFINVFTVVPEKQQQLLDLLIEVTEQVMKKQPGFVSASLHKSLDGVRVTNYAQWESKEAFEAMLRNPEAGMHMAACRDLAQDLDYHLYALEYSEVKEP